jgi:hypothetical protein
MGQQIPFETLDQVAVGLQAVDEPRELVARTVEIGEKRLQRLEMVLTGPAGRETEVHLYEAYWAPITEGKVTLRDVMRFLFRGGINGVRNNWTSFWRWMFGRRVDFGMDIERRWKTSLAFVVALAVLATLVLINAVVGAVGALLIGGASTLSILPGELVTSLAFALGIWLALLAVLAVLAYATRWMEFFYAGVVATILAGVAIVVLGVNGLRATPGAVPALASWFFLVFWVVLVAGSIWIRSLIVQYVGDVAAYISSHHLDRFDEIRTAIKERVGDTFRAVYKCMDAGETGLEYEGVAVVGHSLGSVAAYDGLNAMINEDLLSGGELNVVGRTRLLLTFGSPLDKTAFVFGSRGRRTTESREALAAAVQPLIQDYKYRAFPWINVHSPADIISGPLDFYDDETNPSFTEARVDNQKDPKVTTPLLAHVEYWDTNKTTLIFEKLRAALTQTARHLGAPPPQERPRAAGLVATETDA